MGFRLPDEEQLIEIISRSYDYIQRLPLQGIVEDYCRNNECSSTDSIHSCIPTCFEHKFLNPDFWPGMHFSGPWDFLFPDRNKGRASFTHLERTTLPRHGSIA